MLQKKLQSKRITKTHFRIKSKTSGIFTTNNSRKPSHASCEKKARQTAAARTGIIKTYKIETEIMYRREPLKIRLTQSKIRRKIILVIIKPLILGVNTKQVLRYNLFLVV